MSKRPDDERSKRREERWWKVVTLCISVLGLGISFWTLQRFNLVQLDIAQRQAGIAETTAQLQLQVARDQRIADFSNRVLAIAATATMPSDRKGLVIGSELRAALNHETTPESRSRLLEIVGRLGVVGIKISGTIMDRVNVEGLSLQGVQIADCSLKGARLKNAEFSGGTFVNVDFSDADLSGAQMIRVKLDHVTLTNAVLRGAKLAGSTGLYVDLRQAHLESADLSESEMPHADLRGAHMFGANLRESKLMEARLERADVRGADFTGANLRMADFTSAIISNKQLGIDIKIESVVGGTVGNPRRMIKPDQPKPDDGLIVKALPTEAIFDGADRSYAIWTDGRKWFGK